jgi:hypothetical protein
VEPITVPPSTQPLLYVVVRNAEASAYRGTIALTGPEGWRLSPASREATLMPGETARLSFSIEQARNLESNTYPFEITATGDGASIVRRQDTFAASAPYFTPTIDGQTDDWKDAIPITFATKGKKTTIGTYWSRRRFSILVMVEEDKLVAYPGLVETNALDAVQIALSPLESPNAPGCAQRFEFLVAATGDGARCFRLATPDTPLEQIGKPRELAGSAWEDAEVAVRRDGTVTYYECSLPFRPMQEYLRPSEGREFFLSVLVHDPDGTGIRDLGAAAGLWPSTEDAMAWSRWPGAVWGDDVPRGNKIRWGFCASKY